MNFISGVAFGMFSFGTILTFLVPKQTTIYIEAQKEFNQEAFSRGFMKKEITEDDKVIYNWIEK